MSDPQPTPTPTFTPTASAPAYGPSRGRGRGRGRGLSRGGYYQPVQLHHRNATWLAPGLAKPAQQAEQSRPTPVVQSTTKYTINTFVPNGGYKNKTLVLNKPNGSSSAAPSSADPSRSATPQPPVASTSTATLAPTQSTSEVVIDGVTFVSDPRGNKLTRKPGRQHCIPLARSPLIPVGDSPDQSLTSPTHRRDIFN